MSSIEGVLAAWISLQTSIAGTSLDLRPPAEPLAIARVEHLIGHAFPEELRILYRIADGQKVLTEEDPPATYNRLFAQYRFEPLDEAMRQRAELLATDDGETFSSSWFPFATDGNASGWAVDLAPDKDGSVGQMVRFRNDGNNGTFPQPLIETLQRGLEQLDPMHLHRESNDPLLNDLRRWFHEHIAAPSRAAEESYSEALRPWVFPGRLVRFDTPENYEWLLASLVERGTFCDGISTWNTEGGNRGVQLAHDWLLHTKTITADRHRKLESIRLDAGGRREALLDQMSIQKSTDNGVCRFSSRIPNTDQ